LRGYWWRAQYEVICAREVSQLSSSVDAAGWHDPLAALACNRSDEVEVRVVVEHGDVKLLGGSGDKEVGDLAAPLAALGEETLHL
jgi:hypothetical protein